MEDESWHELGIQDYARAASWRDTALIPLISSGRPLGYLQISNHRKPEMTFAQDEMRLLNIVANQVAPIIDNLTLVTAGPPARLALGSAAPHCQPGGLFGNHR